MDYPIDIVAILEYADAYSEKICDQFFAEKEYVEGRDLKNITTVNQVNAFLVRAVFEAWKAEASQLHSPFFNYDNPTVKEHLNALMRALSGSVSISRDDFEPILEEAIINTIRLTFRPTETLLNYLKGLDKRVPIEKQLKPQLKYLRTHPQFLHKLTATLETEDTIKRKHLLKTVEKLAVNGHLFELPYGVMRQLNETLPVKISEFVPDWAIEGDDDDDDFTEYAAPMAVQSRGIGVDEAALADSFQEKLDHYNQEKYIPEDEEAAIALEEDALSEEEWLGKDGERPITEADIKGYESDEVLQGKVEASANDPHIEASSLSQEKDSPNKWNEPVANTPAGHSSEDTIATEDDDDEIIDNLFDNEPTLEDLDPSVKENPRVEKASIPTSTQEEEQPQEQNTPIEAKEEVEEQSQEAVGNDLHEKFKAQATQEAEGSLHEALAEKKEKQAPRIKIKGTIPLNLKFRFLNELFNGDANAFEEAIDTIDGTEDYHTAISVVKRQYMSKFDWDLGEDTTREFLSMVSRRYE